MMGYFSYTSAYSGRSIPVQTPVVVFMPDNDAYHGIYDGYGRVCNRDGSVMDIPHTLEEWNRTRKEGDPVRVLKMVFLKEYRLLCDQYQWRRPYYSEVGESYEDAYQGYFYQCVEDIFCDQRRNHHVCTG